MGIAIDVLVGLFLVWSLYRGYKQGFLYQMGQAALIIVAYFVARGLGGLLAEPISSEHISEPVAATIGFFSVFLLVVIVGAFFVKKITKELVSFSEGFGKADQVLGIFVGGAKGALLAYIVIVGLIMAHRMTGKVPIPFGSSVAGRWVMQNNFLDSEDFPRARALAKVAWLASTRSRDELAGDPHVQAIISHPKAATLLTPEVLAALGDKDYVTLLTNEAVWDFLDEPDVQMHLNAIEWDSGSGAMPPPTRPPAPPATP